ncbi:MAG: hypothetical protein V3V18_01530 [Methylococcales bacterium]
MRIIILFFSAMLMVGSLSAYAETPKDFESLLIETGEPTIKDESAISISVLWRIDDKMRYSGTGLTFTYGSDARKPDNAVSMASKMVTSIKESMMTQEPSWRGAEVEQITSSDGSRTAALKVTNKQGHSLNEFVIRDYSNQQSVSYQVKPSFGEDGVTAAIDLVTLSADDGGSNPFMKKEKKNPQAKKATGGGIEIAVGDRDSMTIKTVNLTTEEIENKLASALSSSGGYVSTNQIFEDVTDGTTRNVKPFDGHEVQFKSLSGNTIKISVKDPSVSAIIKLKYPDENGTTMEIPMPLVWLLLALVVGGIGYFYWKAQSNIDQDESRY